MFLECLVGLTAIARVRPNVFGRSSILKIEADGVTFQVTVDGSKPTVADNEAPRPLMRSWIATGRRELQQLADCVEKLAAPTAWLQSAEHYSAEDQKKALRSDLPTQARIMFSIPACD